MLIQKVLIRKTIEGETQDLSDVVSVEEPLEIRLEADYEGKRLETKVAVTMRTPGNDEELALGFLFSENILINFDPLLSIAHCQSAFQESGKNNVIRVKLKPGFEFNPALIQRNFFANSSCGVCGKASIEAIEKICSVPIGQGFSVEKSTLQSMPETLRKMQSAFNLTGSIHASALFDHKGNLLAFREDVGRHNALDKLIAHGLLKKINLSNCVLLLSGRISFELVQKAAMAGIPVIAAIGAPSSLAVELAEKMNISLIGFLKNSGFNQYAHFDRIV